MQEPPSPDAANNANPDSETNDSSPKQPTSVTEIPEFQFEGLSQGAACVRIKLGSEVYTLRRTRAEKLVLNK